MRSIAFCALCALGCALTVVCPGRARADDLIVDGSGAMGRPKTLNVTAGTPRRYDNVCIINGGVVTVDPYTKGGDKNIKGNLELIAGTFLLDATSKISVRGAGYAGQLCDAGDGMTLTEGGRGGCSVMDSGGGGAHFGKGGRGTIDNPTVFPRDFEDDCMDHYDTTSTTCKTAANAAAPSGASLCSAGPMNAGPTVAGAAVWHNIYEPEFGAAGGDKGCRDGDGHGGTPAVPITAGSGGGRVVLVGLSERGTTASPCGLASGTVQIDGQIDAGGKRGCGIQNDSGGGGAGGTVLIVGQNVKIGATAKISAAGGIGGDTFSSAVGRPDYQDCAGAQGSGTCDDCGGGGGGGVISVLSVTSQFDPAATFNVDGATGGVCPVCTGEAGGGAGELQLDGGYIGEYCDGYDNDFDGNIDEGLGTTSCGLGTCSQNIASCASGAPPACMPTTTDITCKEPAQNARPRVAVILDTSGSMLLTLSGYPTFGDGSVEHPGIDADHNGKMDDARLFLAREALGQVISAYPEIDFSLARYHQETALNRSCQTATWFECQGLVASYDDPTDNTGATSCNVAYGPNVTRDANGNVTGGADSIAVKIDPHPAAARTECINYAGSCGPPRRGADILSGFGTPVRDMVRWLDGQETAFDPSETPGDFCNHSQGKDCELRATGPTPLAGSLQSLEDYITPIRTEDGAAACRGYDVILVTDGAESCNGDPVAEATRLHGSGINVNVVAVSVLDAEKASLNAIAAAGGTGTATFVTQPQDLVPALTSIIAGAIRFESCNGIDDDCDGKIDEDFPGLGTACDDKMKGICRSTGKIVCNAKGDGTQCTIDMPGGTSSDEKCNSLDDDCDGKVDEGLNCDMVPCTHTGGEVCNGVDDDCDGKIDETDPAIGNPCGNNVGECLPGTTRCVLGSLRCIGGTPGMPEQCNGKDDDCNGMIDDNAPCPGVTVCIEGACRNPCINSEFACPVGQLCTHEVHPVGDFCLPSACALCKSTENCVDDVCVDPCSSVTCADGLICVRGDCRDCTVAGCPSGQICYQQLCQDDLCATQTCAQNEFCFNGTCTAPCDDSQCPKGQLCGTSGVCEADACAAVACTDGQACREGSCELDPCTMMGCGAGDTCVSQLGCIPDPCAVTVCGTGTLCSVGANGAPRCTSPALVQTPRKPVFISTGGSGLDTCSVASVRGSHPPPSAALLLGLFGVALWRRRRRSPKRVGRAGRVLGCVGLSLVAGCRANAICLDCLDAAANSGVDAAWVDSGSSVVPLPDGGALSNEGGAGTGGSGANGTCTVLGDEVCNHLDDDCDGKIDEDFDFNSNVRHCGGCDQPCISDNAETSCQAGSCVTGDCLAGFADLDGQSGCEYRCPLFPAAIEDCNGIDDDCDGKIDEDLVAPSGDKLCRHTKGTPCENVKVICTTREKQTTWFCDYPSVVDFDPVVPDGIRQDEVRCDGQDNDCDGQADEPWPELGTPCDDGKIGACRNGGAMACTSDQKGSVCDLSLPPDPVAGAGPDAIELCNDIDDNCDGIVDNPSPSDPKHVVDDMRPVTHAGHSFYIYTYEASRPDAKGASPGIVTTRSCSQRGAEPWTFVSYAAATAACAASGKRLCTADEWLWSCQGESVWTYPYAQTNYAADSCNGADHDTIAGGGLDNAAVVGGSLAMCVSPAGAFDMSGNVKEWTSEQDMNAPATPEPIYVIRGGSYESPRLGLTCQTELSEAAASTVLGGLGFRCCSDSAP